MNIKSAKEQIKNAMVAYFTKDENGDYIIPLEKQRPLFLIGPPGIGKTAIVEQVAAEMEVGLLSYSMTHHTRQSAIGLPVIEHKKYKQLDCDISRYTMSEIIASIYDLMEDTGLKEGILFLDEINCVSETLSPLMLQFLQYKVFGRHKVPSGWVVVTAGNPLEYNNSAREFDIVTLDRLKRIDIEPDFDSWKEYAYRNFVHQAIISFLDIKKNYFYNVETTMDRKNFVTARGWDDLSEMIKLYELHGIEIDEKLVCQYIQNSKIARDFVVYFELFKKYKSNYQVDKILLGNVSIEVKKRAKEASFDERLSLLGLLLEAIFLKIKNVVYREQVMMQLLAILKKIKVDLKKVGDKDFVDIINDIIQIKHDAINIAKKSGNMSKENIKLLRYVIEELENMNKLIFDIKDHKKAFLKIQDSYNENVKLLEEMADSVVSQLNNLFIFSEEVFGEGQEILVIVTELTENNYSAKFISQYGCSEYYKHNKELLFFERQQEIFMELNNLNLHEI